MQFSVPQFIDIEDKIFGPLTLKQFIYILGGIGLSFVLYKLLPLYIAFFIIIPVFGLTFMLAFKPIHGRPFVVVLESALRFTIGSKLYLWKKESKLSKKDGKRVKTAVQKSSEEPIPTIPKVIEGKLDDMALSLDINPKTPGSE